MLSTLLFIILVIYLIGYFLRWAFPRLAMWYMRRKTESAMRDFFGASNQSYNRGRNARQRSSRQQAQPRRHTKIFDKTVGEYVEFEEISTFQSTDSSVADTAQVKYTEESQISDVEWEDIK